MPRIDPRPFGGPSYSGGVYGTPANPMEWQHQPGDHSDTRILPLLTPLSGTAGVAFGFSTSATGTQTFTGTADPAFLPLIVSPAPAEDDGDDLLLMVAVMRSRLRL